MEKIVKNVRVNIHLIESQLQSNEESEKTKKTSTSNTITNNFNQNLQSKELLCDYHYQKDQALRIRKTKSNKVTLRKFHTAPLRKQKLKSIHRLHIFST